MSSINVACRIRPFNKKEQETDSVQVLNILDERSLSLQVSELKE